MKWRDTNVIKTISIKFIEKGQVKTYLLELTMDEYKILTDRCKRFGLNQKSYIHASIQKYVKDCYDLGKIRQYCRNNGKTIKAFIKMAILG